MLDLAVNQSPRLSWEQSLTSEYEQLHPNGAVSSVCLCVCSARRYDFLGKDSDKPEHANGSAAPGKSSEERRHREHRSSRDRDGTKERHRDKERDRGEDRDRGDGHRSSSRDHRSHKSSRHRDERDHRSSKDRERPREEPRDRFREDPRGQEAFKRPRTQEFLPRPPPPRFVKHGHTAVHYRPAPVHLC